VGRGRMSHAAPQTTCLVYGVKCPFAERFAGPAHGGPAYFLQNGMAWYYLLPPPVPPPLPPVLALLPPPPLMLPELPELMSDEPLPPEPLVLLEPLEPAELLPDELLPLWDLCLLLSSVDLAAALPVLPEEPLVPEFESLAAGMLLFVPEPVDGPEGELCA